MEPLYTPDVLVVGCGGAGLRAALELHAQGQQVLVVGKRPRADAHTVLAAGGINAALATMDAADSWAIHAADTLQEGRMLGDPVAVELLCKHAPQALAELIEWGVPFAREADGRISQRYFGAHRYRRTAFVGDYTGQEIIAALLRQIDRHAIAILERVYIADLLVHHGQVNGALGFELDSGTEVLIQARAVILAAGGHIHVYQRSSSRKRENTGDAMALALKVGATLADMELVQFHPSGMIWPQEVQGTLVTEAVRGEGGHLFNRHGERFMTRYDPERVELSTRDRVALANYTEILEGRGTAHGGVWLDVSHLSADHIQQRLPRMVEQFAALGIDITREPMEIAPTAHYSMGGIKVDPHTHATGIAGLYAAGEATAGVHGANRLGGNSLAEILVSGRLAGRHAGHYAATHPAPAIDQQLVTRLRNQYAWWRERDGASLRTLIDTVQQCMWQGAGVVRSADSLNRALSTLGRCYKQAQTVAPGADDLAAALDLQAMLLAAEATVRSALARTESRGAHQRTDYPHAAPAWRKTMTIKGRFEQGLLAGLLLDTQALAEPSPEVAQWLTNAAVDTHGKLLE